MKALKTTIYITLVLIIIVAILLLMFNSVETSKKTANNISNNINQNGSVNYILDEYGGNSFELNEDIILIDNPTIYFSIKEIADKFFEKIDKLDVENIKKELRLESKDTIKEEREIIIASLKAMVNEEDKYSNIDIFEKYINTNFEIKSIYSKNKSDRITVFFIEGYIQELKENYNLIIITDTNNATYTIFSNEYILGKYEDINFKNNMMTTNITEIENNFYNQFSYTNITDEDMARKYFSDYKYIMQYDIEKAYNLLNETYREKRFVDIENYKNYINKNINTIKNANADKYLIKERDGYVEYTLIDTYGNYYIFNEKSVMDYEVILDTYTIDIPEFVEKYNESDEELKVKMNIGRFFDAIKEEDYNYAYQKLDDNFKSQYFKTIAEFEQYAKTTLVYDEEIEYNEFTEIDGMYTCKVELSEEENILEKTFTIELLEGTDYKIAFNIN